MFCRIDFRLLFWVNGLEALVLLSKDQDRKTHKFVAGVKTERSFKPWKGSLSIGGVETFPNHPNSGALLSKDQFGKVSTVSHVKENCQLDGSITQNQLQTKEPFLTIFEEACNT